MSRGVWWFLTFQWFWSLIIIIIDIEQTMVDRSLWADNDPSTIAWWINGWFKWNVLHIESMSTNWHSTCCQYSRVAKHTKLTLTHKIDYRVQHTGRLYMFSILILELFTLHNVGREVWPFISSEFSIVHCSNYL